VHLVGFITRNFITMHSHMNVKLYKNAFFICLNLVIQKKYFTCTIHAYVLSIFNNQHSIITYYSCLCFHSKRGTCNSGVCWENSVISHIDLSRASFFSYIPTFQNCVEKTVYRLTSAGLPPINRMSQHLPTPCPTQIEH
jgi:hypothetical protein